MLFDFRIKLINCTHGLLSLKGKLTWKEFGPSGFIVCVGGEKYGTQVIFHCKETNEGVKLRVGAIPLFIKAEAEEVHGRLLAAGRPFACTSG